MQQSFENPVSEARDDASLFHKKKHALHRGTTVNAARVVMECNEDEEHLAEAHAEREDLHELLTTHLSMADLQTPKLSADEVLRHCGIDSDDDYMVVSPSNMKDALVKVTGSSIDEISDRRVLELMHQIDRDTDDQVTVAEFKAWWKQRQAHALDPDVADEVLDSHAIALARMQLSNMIHPNSSFRKRWDICQALLIVYLAFACPYRVSFDDGVALWSGWFFLDLFIDLYFISDVCLNFRTAVITRDGEVLYKQKDVNVHYLKSWFAVDFISCLPLEYTGYLTGTVDNTRLLRMFKLLKLLRLVRIKRIMDRWEEDLYSTGWLDGLKLLALILVSSHWICCAWFFVGCPLPGEEQQGWVTRHYAGEGGWQSQGTGQLYLDSAFFSLMAVVMISATDPQGNLYPYDTTEKFMYSGAFLVGAVVMSLIIGAHVRLRPSVDLIIYQRRLVINRLRISAVVLPVRRQHVRPDRKRQPWTGRAKGGVGLNSCVLPSSKARAASDGPNSESLHSILPRTWHDTGFATAVLCNADRSSDRTGNFSQIHHGS